MIDMKIKRSAIGSSIVALFVVVALATAAWAGGKPLHHVSVGGPDACEALGFDGPGCDANYSFTAIQFYDTTVNGQFTDQFGHGNGGIHAVLDCLYVSGNQAWVSGIITHDTATGSGAWVGLRVAATVVDNGNSKKDPPDQISFSNIGDDRPCTDMVAYALLDFPDGQVKVR